MGKKDEKLMAIRILFWSAVVYNVAVWVDLVSMLNYWGFHYASTPVQIGVLVMSFSGSMALATALGTGRIRQRNELVMMTSAASSGVIMALHLFNQSFAIAILLILLKGLFIGTFVNGQNALLQRVCSSQQYAAIDNRFERLAAIIKCAGPLAAGLSVMIWQPQVTVWLAAIIYVIAAVPIVYLFGHKEAGGPYSHEAAHDTADDVKTNAAIDSTAGAYLTVGLIILASMSFFVTVGDSQLVVLFRDIFLWNNAAIVAFVMAAAGLGTLLIRIGSESYNNTAPFKALTFSSLGLSAVFLIVTWAMNRQIGVLWFLVLFFAGGVCWQIGFSFYLKKLNQMDSSGGMTNKFSTVMALTYILGPLFGGAGVAWLGINTTYLLAGICLLGFSLIFSAIYLSIHVKRRRTGQGASHSLNTGK
ncbi:MFS transporter [Paenibacillus apiarius]|uniref:MFS transporter n=1 Tax=Paenibacillus apiarius TaxID=46240 RepID=UPI00197F0540|nr:MFS transporter [Paenibacillus apiarius]MBN3527353.1 MFS transporter [Paenibacillus apiarius]